MLSRFFAPVIPVDSMGKVWVEGRLRWLLDEFGDEPFLARPPAMPTTADFPELRGGSTLQALYERICERVGIDPARVPLRVAQEKKRLGLVNGSGHEMGGEAAHYAIDEDGEHILMQSSELADPISLIGTLAHELSHARLLGEGRVHGGELDHELLTDLCATFHGFGLFLANQPRAWLSDCGTWPDSKLVRPAYMTVNLYAWALTHRAMLANEREPTWLAGLQSEPRRLVRDGVRWLSKHGDSALVTGDWSKWNALAPQLDPPGHPSTQEADRS